jgi:hypothetical protein
MTKHLLKAWLLGLAIAFVVVMFTTVVHTPFALVGMILSVPILPVLLLFTKVTEPMGLSDATGSILLPVCLVLGGSLIYGSFVFAVLKLRERRANSKPRSTTPADTLPDRASRSETQAS